MMLSKYGNIEVFDKRDKYLQKHKLIEVMLGILKFSRYKSSRQSAFLSWQNRSSVVLNTSGVFTLIRIYDGWWLFTYHLGSFHLAKNILCVTITKLLHSVIWKYVNICSKTVVKMKRIL